MSTPDLGRYPWENLWRGVLFWGAVFLVHLYWKQRRENAKPAVAEPEAGPESPAEGGLEAILKQQADPNVKIGGETEKYSWDQNETEVEISLPVDQSTKKKNVEILFKPRRLLVQVNFASPAIEGELYQEIVPDECTWMFDTKSDGTRFIAITLLKKYRTEANQHWNCVIRGEGEIDVSGLGPKVVAFDPSADNVKDFVSGLRKRRA
jgi:hypothetical protein|eukprot:g8833.t1